MPSAPSSATARAVVFDLDGLMFNTEELYQDVGGELLRRRGKVFTSQLLDAMMGRPNRIALQIMIDWHTLGDTVDVLIAETEEIFVGILDARLELMPGLADLLGALEEAAIPKAIATSSPRRFVTNVLARFELEPRFAFVLTSEDVVEGKPHPEIYQTAARRLNVAPSQMMVLEDSQNGCRAAAAAGAITVAVPGGHSRQQDFSCATLVANTLADPRIYQILGLARGLALPHQQRRAASS
ncbi:MAG TPA: HAD family hydrolase [Pirellulales bacterium]|jgi:HAD superfamily hydrolase (TIGR01509 family)|nr:HAD family hydrolase [Pirellulales bacterium]